METPDVDFLPETCLLRVAGVVLAHVHLSRSRLVFLREGDIVLHTHCLGRPRGGCSVKYRVLRRRGCVLDCRLDLTPGATHA